MKLSTENVSLVDDMSSDTCKDCAGLRADVEMSGQKVRSVRLHCVVADVVAADCLLPSEKMRKIKAAARKVLGNAIDPDMEYGYGCEALNNAACVLDEMEEDRNRYRQRRRRYEPKKGEGVVETRGTRRYPPGQRPEGVWETNDGSDASRWVVAQGRKFKE